MLHDFQSVSDYFMTLQSKGLSCNDPSKLVPYSFEPLLILQIMKIVTLSEKFNNNHPAIVELGILNDVNAIIGDR